MIINANPYYHLGRGYQYPFRYHNGRVEQAESLESIKASIRLILDTRQGEIFMMPHIGCRLWELIFSTVDEVFYALAQQYILQALYDQEPRVSNVTVQFKPQETANSVTILVAYNVVNTGFHDVLEYEFVVNPTEGV